ncbi:hypothetical protein [Pectobacterium versatile]|uniref:hypothetical protein n=1 Tax=Pectobacterium versatile TaxID=2488639 RepID=UPI000F64569D|nr:hypothetical protein [Pectobacterium versatile]AZK62174.1 hypothetical protein EIP93_07585 [Pectobacterium versatile]
MFYKILFLESKNFYSTILDESIFEGCEKHFNGGDLLKNIGELASYDLVIYTIYSSPIYNHMISYCKKVKVKTLLLMDGICEINNFTKNENINSLGIKNYHPILADNIAVVGNSARRYFSVLGVNAIRHLPPRISKLKYNQHLVSSMSKKTDFLITTANTAYFNNIEFENLVSLLKDVIYAIEKNGYSIIFRVFDERLIEELKIDPCNNIKNGSFTDVLSLVSCVITTPSSIALTSMIENLPVGLLQFRDSPNFLQTGWIIIKGYDLSETLSSMIRKDEIRMRFQISEVMANTEVSSALSELQLSKQTQTSEQILSFWEQNYLNILSSPFNFNFEHLARKIYWRLKSNKIFSFIRKLLHL